MVHNKSHRIAPDDDDTSFFSPSPVPSIHPTAASSSEAVDPKDVSAASTSMSTVSGPGSSESSKDTCKPIPSASTNHPQGASSSPSYTPPWTEPYIIGVAGYSGSGKTSISQKIIQELNQPWTILLSFDNFYNPLSAEERQQAHDCEFDFDTPKSLDFELLNKCVRSLKNGRKTEIPNYSFVEHNRTDKKTTIYGANVIIIEGIYALYDQRLLDMMDVKIFVDTDLDICLARRLTRDILVRGRELHGSIKQWETFVKPNAVRHVAHTMNNADLVIPRGLDNLVGINMMIKHIQNQLTAKSLKHIEHLKELGTFTEDFNIELLPDIKILPSNSNHLKGVHSKLLSKETDRSDFIFYFDIIAFQIIELALQFINDYEPIQVPTFQGYTYSGVKSNEDKIIAVNIIRSGDCFMNAIKKTLPEIVIGKLLIQSDSQTGEPQLHTESLPPSIKQRRGSVVNTTSGTSVRGKIFLFDAQIISGAASIMAIQVLIDYGVQVSDIVLCSYLSTEVGIRRIIHAFPGVKLSLGKVSNMQGGKPNTYNPEGFKDIDWVFSNRFIDSLYFGTD